MEDPKIEELDLYEILEIEPTTTTQEIKKAYRKKALQCHPDKNPDNPNAAKEFHRLSKILEVLVDETARKVYDRVLKGRKEAALRHRELDSKRRKLKEELEEREKRAGGQKRKTEEQKLREEIERLRKEGSRQVQEEIDKIQQELREQRLNEQDSGVQYRIKIKWKSDKQDPDNGGYTSDLLHKFLGKYGNVKALVVSSRRTGSALVEFETRNAAEMAVEMECGLSTNPMTLEWVQEPPAKTGSVRTRQSNLVKPSDFESVILTKMRQAEERKRLIEQMKAEDDD